jgi:hypothetical protein
MMDNNQTIFITFVFVKFITEYATWAYPKSVPEAVSLNKPTNLVLSTS